MLAYVYKSTVYQVKPKNKSCIMFNLLLHCLKTYIYLIPSKYILYPIDCFT